VLLRLLLLELAETRLLPPHCVVHPSTQPAKPSLYPRSLLLRCFVACCPQVHLRHMVGGPAMEDGSDVRDEHIFKVVAATPSY